MIRNILLATCVFSHTSLGAAKATVQTNEVQVRSQNGKIQCTTLLKVIVNRSEGDDSHVVAYHRTNRGLDDLKKYRRYPDKMLSLDELKGKKVLDLGIGDGRFVLELRRAGIDAHGLDIYLTPEQKGEEYLFERDAKETGFPDATYDVIYSTLSIFSYEQKNAPLLYDLLLEIKRILKPGGRLRLSPIQPKLIEPVLSKIPGLRVSQKPDADWIGQKYFEIEKE